MSNKSLKRIQMEIDGAKELAAKLDARKITLADLTADFDRLQHVATSAEELTGQIGKAVQKPKFLTLSKPLTARAKDITDSLYENMQQLRKKIDAAKQAIAQSEQAALDLETFKAELAERKAQISRFGGLRSLFGRPFGDKSLDVHADMDFVHKLAKIENGQGTMTITEKDRIKEEVAARKATAKKEIASWIESNNVSSYLLRPVVYNFPDGSTYTASGLFRVILDVSDEYGSTPHAIDACAMCLTVPFPPDTVKALVAEYAKKEKKYVQATNQIHPKVTDVRIGDMKRRNVIMFTTGDGGRLNERLAR